MIDIGKEKLTYNCPKCGRKITFTLNQVAKQATVKCSGCGEHIKLQDSNSSARLGISQINKSFRDFERTLKQFGK